MTTKQIIEFSACRGVALDRQIGDVGQVLAELAAKCSEEVMAQLDAHGNDGASDYVAPMVTVSVHTWKIPQ